MAGVSETEGEASENDGEGEDECNNAPAASLGKVEELLARNDVPAYLQMHGKRADEDCGCQKLDAQRRGKGNCLLHTAIARPPQMRSAPDQAHVKLENMSLGVISLKH